MYCGSFDEREWELKSSGQACLNQARRQGEPTQNVRQESDRNHTILFHCGHFRETKTCIPFPESFCEKWDNGHVKMPCSKANRMSSMSSSLSFSETVPKWEIITEKLKRKISDIDELKATIFSYNPSYYGIYSFTSLEFLISQMRPEEKFTFFDTLEKMKALALMLPFYCTQAVPILRQGENKKITMSQLQAACLLANAFFCTFPVEYRSDKSTPDINFIRLFGDSRDGSLRKVEKLKCIVHYFEKVTSDTKGRNGTITFTRRCLFKDELPNWQESRKKFTTVTVEDESTIEDTGAGKLKIDFANKYVGGGVLGSGLAQEEILFLICPEMIVSRLFTEPLDSDEVLILTGCERFSRYQGYGVSFRYAGDYEDKTQRDDMGRICSEVVAMDALCFHGHDEQFEKKKILRELQKAYCAFVTPKMASEIPICTGNWGCGAFGGDLQLKALIQMCAAAEAERDVFYVTHGDREFGSKLSEVLRVLKANNISVSTALGMINHYTQKYINRYFSFVRKPCPSLFDFIISKASERPSLSNARSNSNSSGTYDRYSMFYGHLPF